MKKIFDWMREQMHEARFPITDLKVGVKENGIQVTDDAVLFERANELINEAEAKWETDCCEWKQYHGKIRKRWANCNSGTNDFNTFTLKRFNFCPYCGKPIKISEVE